MTAGCCGQSRAASATTCATRLQSRRWPSARPDLAPMGRSRGSVLGCPSLTLERAPAIEHARPDPAAWQSRTLPDTGYVVSHDAAGGHSVFDAGVHGYMNGGHAHADALSLTICSGAIVRCSSIPAHRPTRWTHGFATGCVGQLNHNTVTVDGRPQSTPAGPFHWRTTANGRLHASRHNAGFDWVEASHDGYSPIEHRRSIVRADGAGWLVVDEIVAASPSFRRPASPRPSRHAAGRHSAATHWHFDPGWTLKAEAPDGCARRMSKATRRGC